MAYQLQLVGGMYRLLVLVIVLVGACATDPADDYQCEVECPEPPEVVQHVEDLRRTQIRVTADSTTDLMAPAFTTITVRFDYGGLSTPGCPVLDPGLTMSLAGVPGRITARGGAYRGARWRCGDLKLEFTPTTYTGLAPLSISDDSGELLFDLGDVLLARTLATVSDPDWTFVDGAPATFRWSPAADVATLTSIGISWGKPTATVLVEQPITHVDPVTFSIPLPPGAGTSLWFTVPVFRSCGENCTLSIWSEAWHSATLTPP